MQLYSDAHCSDCIIAHCTLLQMHFPWTFGRGVAKGLISILQKEGF